jgi:hypothetical protein
VNTRLQPLNVTSFVGGLNARRSQFTLGNDESPDMLNMEIDPRAGFFTRRGWQRWNADDVTDASVWYPRLAKQHLLSTGTFDVYVANREGASSSDTGKLYRSTSGGVFSDTGVECNAYPHMADFAAWGDEMYVATGRGAADVSSTPVKSDSTTITALADAALAFNDDYTIPVGGRMPFADMVEAHAGYLFVAGTREGGVDHPNRIRWSHPDQPEDWATLDFLDINRGGGRITGLLSFRDHLLIFKSDSVFALYGYDLESWQLIQVSMSIGAPHTGALTRSENATYFYSASDRGGIYAYTGESPIHITEKLRSLIEQITDFNAVFVEWTGRRLWCPVGEDILVFDPEIGQGSWVRHRPGAGTMGPIVKRSDPDSEYPLACLNGDSGAAVLVRLDFRDDCFDVILSDYAIALTDELTGNILTDELTGNIITTGEPARGTPFETYYRTRWFDAGWPERRKSWRRPRFVIRRPKEPVLIRADVFWDYDETNVRRSRVGLFEPTGGGFWTTEGAADPEGLGFDWGDGTLWGETTAGGSLERVGAGLGVTPAIQIRVSSDPATAGRAWAVDGFILKFVLRRFTT